MTWGYDSWGYWNGNKPTEEEKPLTKACTCGMNITSGYEVPADRHSDWCDLYRKEENDNSKTSERRHKG